MVKQDYCTLQTQKTLKEKNQPTVVLQSLSFIIYAITSSVTTFCKGVHARQIFVSGSVNTEVDFIALDWEFKKSLTDQI